MPREVLPCPFQGPRVHSPLWLEDQQAPARPYRLMSRIIVSVATAW